MEDGYGPEVGDLLLLLHVFGLFIMFRLSQEIATRIMLMEVGIVQLPEGYMHLI